MDWKHRWAEFGEHIVANYRLSGLPVPDHLIEPETGAVEIAMIDAWGDLTSDRNTDMGPIPFSAIDRWATRHGVEDADEFDFLTRAIRAADKAYLAWAAEELKRRTAK